MFANGNSFANGSTYINGQSMNGSSIFSSDPRNTEPFYWRFLLGIQQGALL